MEAILRVSKDELNARVIKKLLSLIPDDFIEIRLRSIDATEYLLSTPENKESILKSLEQYKKGEFVIKSLEELENLAND